MKNPKPKKQARKQQVPPLHEQDANPYPLELVANIAMQMIIGQHVRVRDGDSGITLYSDTVQLALHFLDECEGARLYRQVRRKQQADSILRDAEMKREYPNGMPFLKALLHITGSRSEADALPAFKMWLREQKLADWNSFPPVPTSEEVVTQFIEGARTNNFPIFVTDRPGMPQRFTLDEERGNFQQWKQYSYLPRVKQANAGKGQRKKK